MFIPFGCVCKRCHGLSPLTLGEGHLALCNPEVDACVYTKTKFGYINFGWQFQLIVLATSIQNLYFTFSPFIHFGSDAFTFLYFSQSSMIILLWKLAWALFSTCIATCQTTFCLSHSVLQLQGVKVKDSSKIATKRAIKPKSKQFKRTTQHSPNRLWHVAIHLSKNIHCDF